MFRSPTPLLLAIVLSCLIPLARGDTPAYELVATYPHADRAFTQGLEIHDGMVLESSGRYGMSYIVRGILGEKPAMVRRLPANMFAEGLTVLDGKLYLLTWRNQGGLILDPHSLELLGNFRYHGEGWGLANDDKQLIMSNGSGDLQFINPENFTITRRVRVTHNGHPITRINELEWHNGLLLANQWHHDHLLVIEPESGDVLQIIDLSDLYPTSQRLPDANVLNGIAYDGETDTWLVTGKLWPYIYRLRLSLPDVSPPSNR